MQHQAALDTFRRGATRWLPLLDGVSARAENARVMRPNATGTVNCSIRPAIVAHIAQLLLSHAHRPGPGAVLDDGPIEPCNTG